MRRLDVAIPTTWRPIDPPRTDYDVGGVRVILSAVQGMPEDPGEWIRGELRRRAQGHAIADTAIVQRAAASGWPIIACEAQAGDRVVIATMFLFLEYAATVIIEGASAAVARERAAIVEVLDRATIDWGLPPPTLALLLDGATRT
ncbi:MAG: hypothetical protein K8W52_09715 [Deltaproteobacteria bacterium]|nr:hypothetical protein [Deltaproteobacteria bacterium]